MKDRILKCLLCIVLIPVIWMVLLVVGAAMLLLPILAFIHPEKIKICENNNCISIFSNNSKQTKEEK